jgi:SAM-dependent methyltransferase
MSVPGIFTWTAKPRTIPCPVCGDRESKRGLLHVADYAEHAGTRGKPLDLLQCPSCDARFYDPPITIDHYPGGLVKFYIEQGAGIDVMLQPLTLLDGRPISRYLEIGCGFGFSLDYARRVLGWQVEGYDPGLAAAHGRELLGLPISSRYFDGSAGEAGSVDLLFCSEVIEHIRDPIEYLRGVRSALDRNGLLLMTTPNGDAVQPGMPADLMPMILCPGQHLILYNGRAIRRLLEENGFPYLRVRESEHQICVCASAVPFAGEGTYFTRDLLRQYLADGASRHSVGSPLALGFGYRLFKELVNAGRYADGREPYERLRSGILDRYGYDIEKHDGLTFPAPGTVSLSEFSEKWPLNLCGIWYYRGIIQLLHERDPERASHTFEAASAFGRAMRATLHAFGADDLETANLCREAELARLAALAQCDASGAFVAFQQLSRNLDGCDAARLTPHVGRARSRLFIDRVAPLRGLTGSLSIITRWLRRPLGRESVRSTSGSRSKVALQLPPNWKFQDSSRGEDRLDHKILAAHVTRARERLFTDLVNLGHYAIAEQVIGSQELMSDAPVTLDRLAFAFACGIYMLNHKLEYAVAYSIFGKVWEAARESPTDPTLLWSARFHQALASRYGGDRQAAERIAAEIAGPVQGLPPVPAEYRQRLRELSAPP